MTVLHLEASTAMSAKLEVKIYRS